MDNAVQAVSVETKVIPVAISLTKNDFTLWHEHPLTQVLMQCLVEIRDRDNASFVRGVKLNEEQYVLERNLYKLSGQQQLINKLVDSETLRDNILSQHVTWADI